MTADLNESSNQIMNETSLCSAELIAGKRHQIFCFVVLNIFFSITAFLGNTLILVALHKKTSLHPPSKLLLRGLATTDLCVGLIAEPLHVCYWISLLNEQWNICRYASAATFITSDALGLASLSTLTAVSVDRLLALLLGLRYRQLVTLKRMYLTVTIFWVFSIVGPVVFLTNRLISYIYNFIIISFYLVTSIYCYMRIFLRLRRHQTHVQDNVQRQPSQAFPITTRYRKAVSSALWLQFALVVCYLPFSLATALVISKRGKRTSSLFLEVASATTLVYLNSSLNPVLYCWKINEVRQVVKETIKDLREQFVVRFVSGLTRVLRV